MKSLNIELDATSVPKTDKKAWFGWIRFILFLAILYFLIHYGIGIKIVNGDSMNPTLHDKGIFVVNKVFFKPERGDIVVVKDPDGFDIVKRIIGLPNDRVKISDGVVYLNGQPLNEPYIKGKALNMDEVTVEEGKYFIMGDNRTPGESLDSRDPSIGTILEKNIVGGKMF
ncbi:signal peptidase I [Heyndrickxia sp. NPDC080065]|uniref:signal peptidase I n=1 Tax=Heyndrickxia sp. NPDC080065 TaxID=3390568 RepID=UPI003CFF3C66